MAESEKYESWTYTCECTQCHWRAEYVEGEEWERGAARRHANMNNHKVKTISIKMIIPDQEKMNKEPSEADREVAWCRQCERHVGVGAGRMFRAAVKSHAKHTYHDVDITPNPKFKKKVKPY